MEARRRKFGRFDDARRGSRVAELHRARRRANGGNNRGRMPVVHDDDNLTWHVYWTKETVSGSDQLAVGQRVYHAQLNDQFANTLRRGDRSGPRVARARLLPATRPAATSVFSTSSCPPLHGRRFQATACTQSSGTTRGSIRRPRKGAIWGSFSKTSGTCGTFSDVEVDQAGAPWPFTGENGNTPWGDYEGMAADDSGDFVPAWGDNRLQGAESTNTHVWWRVWGP